MIYGYDSNAGAVYFFKSMDAAKKWSNDFTTIVTRAQLRKKCSNMNLYDFKEMIHFARPYEDSCF